MGAAFKSLAKQLPKWMKNKLKSLLDRHYGTTPDYAQYEPLIQPVITFFCDVNYAKLITLFEQQNYEGIKNEFVNYMFAYLESNKIDPFVPAQYKLPYLEVKALLLKYKPNSLRMSWSVSLTFFQYSRRMQEQAQLGDLDGCRQSVKAIMALAEQHMPGFYKEAFAICRKYGLLDEATKTALVNLGYDR